MLNSGSNGAKWTWIGAIAEKLNPLSSGTKRSLNNFGGTTWTWIGAIAEKLNPLSSGTERNLNTSGGTKRITWIAAILLLLAVAAVPVQADTVDGLCDGIIWDRNDYGVTGFGPRYDYTKATTSQKKEYGVRCRNKAARYRDELCTCFLSKFREDRWLYKNPIGGTLDKGMGLQLWDADGSTKRSWDGATGEQEPDCVCFMFHCAGKGERSNGQDDCCNKNRPPGKFGQNQTKGPRFATVVNGVVVFSRRIRWATAVFCYDCQSDPEYPWEGGATNISSYCRLCDASCCDYSKTAPKLVPENFALKMGHLFDYGKKKMMKIPGVEKATRILFKMFGEGSKIPLELEAVINAERRKKVKQAKAVINAERRACPGLYTNVTEVVRSDDEIYKDEEAYYREQARIMDAYNREQAIRAERKAERKRLKRLEMENQMMCVCLANSSCTCPKCAITKKQAMRMRLPDASKEYGPPPRRKFTDPFAPQRQVNE